MKIASYVIGFITAVALTLVAYFAVVQHWLMGWPLILTIMSLAVIQLLVQLLFFLHLGRGPEARWNVAALLFMLLILVVIVAGSLWIMDNLNYNMKMTPEQMDAYMRQQGNKGF